MNTITINLTNNQINIAGLLAGTTLALIIFAIGYSLVKFYKQENRSRIGKYLLWASPVVLGVAIFIYIPEIRNVLVALASIIAVVIAIFSFDQSRSIRQDSLDREKRERKERLLNEIIEWGENIINCGTGSITEQKLVTNISNIAERMQADNWFLTIVKNDMGEYEKLITKMTYFEIIVKTWDSKLSELIKNTGVEIVRHLSLLNALNQEYGELGSMDLTIHKKRTDHSIIVGQHKTLLNQEANKLIAEASKLKIENIK